MLDPEVLDAALERACDQVGIPAHYRSSVRPLVRDPEGYWPRCCDSGCEPCARDLNAAAARTLAILGTPRTEPIPD